MKHTFLTMAAAMAAAITIQAQTARHFVLANSDDGQSELHCFLPEQSNGRAVIACPGGAYGGLSFEKEGTNWAGWFNAQGIAYFTLKYRLPNGNPTVPLGDAYQAVRTVRDSAAVWHINRRDVGIMGFSAGGHLAATVSTHAPADARPDFSILVYPVITMQKGTHEGTWRRFLGDKKVAKKNKLEVIDLRQAITDAKMLVSDGIHPNHNGAKEIAKMVADAIKRK